MSVSHRPTTVMACVLRVIAIATLVSTPLVARAAPPTGTPPLPSDGARIAFLGIWDRAAPLLEMASRDADVTVRVLARPVEPAALLGVGVLYVLNLRPNEARALVDMLKGMDEPPRVVALDQRDSQAALLSAKLLVKDPRVPLYWRANGRVNLRRLLDYTRITYLGAPGEAEPPVVVPDRGYYVPGEADLLAELAAVKARGWRDDAPTAALVMQSSFWVTGDLAVIDATIQALRGAGFNVACFFADQPAKLAEMLRALAPDVVVEDRHGSMPEEDGETPIAELLDAPRLRPISMLAYTQSEWEADPMGLHPRDRNLFMALQERHGTIEPLVIGALKVSTQGFRVHVPVDGRPARFAGRARSWARLRRAPDAEKRIAIVYYNKGLGKDDLMRGSPTGAFLDAPESAVRFLPRLAKAGFALGTPPADAEALLDRIRASGRNIGPWAQGELDEMADHPDVELVPLSTYRGWFEGELDPAQQKAVIDAHGPPPGRLMVVQRNGQPHIVLPAVRLGPGVILMPQPERGEKVDAALLHSADVPPPHNYLAFYWWLQKGYRADAVMHWGTHGSLELLPGKEAGLHPRDWGDVLVGEMPIINPWIMDNLGEASLSRRRSYAALIDHLPPAPAGSTLLDELSRLDLDIERFRGLEPGVLRESFRSELTTAAREARIDETLGLPGPADRPLGDDEILAVHDYLHALEGEHTPTSLHIMGQAPDAEGMAAWGRAMLGRTFREGLGRVRPIPPEQDHDAAHRTAWLAEQVAGLVERSGIGDAALPADVAADEELAEAMARLRKVVARIGQADAEIEGIIRALRGRYVRPGPGPDPARNGASVPSGRNLYTLNPEEIPVRAAWAVGLSLVDALLAEKTPTKVGFDLNGMNTMRDFGVIESQILYLLGTRPVWDENDLVTDVELIPRAELGRPRVDVFIAMGGTYKENFPTRVKLLGKAVELAAAADEADNGVRAGSDRQRTLLLEKGFSEARAEAMRSVRIFGTKPGNMSGTNILNLVPRSGVWNSTEEITSVYVDSMSYAYGGELWGERVGSLYESAIQGTDTLVRAWASNMTSQLSNHHAYEYLGGLSMAVTQLTGQVPEAFIADVRDPGGGRLRKFEEVLATNLRTELLNPGWIEGMKANEYAGAGMMAELVRNTFGWSVTRPTAVSAGVWQDIYETYVDDTRGLDLKAFFEKHNPHAEQEILATLIEAGRKGYWQPTPEQAETLARRYAESVARHGPSAGLVSGGNDKLDDTVREALQAPGDQARVAAFDEAMQKSRGAGKAPADKVAGQKMVEQKAAEAEAEATDGEAPPSWVPIIGLLVLALMGLGAWRRWGGVR